METTEIDNLREIVITVIKKHRLLLECKEKVNYSQKNDGVQELKGFKKIDEPDNKECGEYRNNLLEYLESLTEKEIIYLIGFMYEGRDKITKEINNNSDKLINISDELINISDELDNIQDESEGEDVTLEQLYNKYKHWKKNDAIFQMLGKVPLSDFLETGSQIYFRLY